MRVETRPVPVFFPNTECRVTAAKLHDLHHVATEYETDWAGEAEIAAWEIASGCGRYGWAWLLNLGAFTVGLALCPKRLLRAFVRGRRASNLYSEGFAEELLVNTTVDALRQRIGFSAAEPRAGWTDRLAFGLWCAVALAWHFVLPGAILTASAKAVRRL